MENNIEAIEEITEAVVDTGVSGKKVVLGLLATAGICGLGFGAYKGVKALLAKRNENKVAEAEIKEDSTKESK